MSAQLWHGKKKGKVSEKLKGQYMQKEGYEEIKQEKGKK